MAKWKRNCFQEGCDKRPRWQLAQGGPVYCRGHRPVGTVLVGSTTNEKCQHPGCRRGPVWGVHGEAPSRCPCHKQEGDSLVLGKCRELGCFKKARRGWPGEPPIYCGEHRKEGMQFALKSRMCKHPGCFKQASFGHQKQPDGSEGTVLFCEGHKQLEMVNLRSRRCKMPNCYAQPRFGVLGEDGPDYCAQHRTEEMIDLRNPQCAVPNCSDPPKYNEPGKKAKFCMNHKLPEHVKSGVKTCEAEGCPRQPVYGHRSGTEEPSHCIEHKLEGMENLHKACEYPGCTKWPQFCFRGGPPRFCSPHRMPGMIACRKRQGGPWPEEEPFPPGYAVDKVFHNEIIRGAVSRIQESPEGLMYTLRFTADLVLSETQLQKLVEDEFTRTDWPKIRKSAVPKGIQASEGPANSVLDPLLPSREHMSHALEQHFMQLGDPAHHNHGVAMGVAGGGHQGQGAPPLTAPEYMPHLGDAAGAMYVMQAHPPGGHLHQQGHDGGEAPLMSQGPLPGSLGHLGTGLGSLGDHDARHVSIAL